MSGFFRPRNLAIAGGIGAAFLLFPRTASKASPVGGTDSDSNVFETPGTKNIGNRYSAGGGSDTHIPGVATRRGDQNNTVTSQLHPTGVDTAHFQENQAEQKVGDQSSRVGAAFRSAQYGENNTKGK